MKKFFYVFLALVTAAMIACDPQPKPDVPDDPTPGDDDDPAVESLIDVTDGTDADWANVPAEYLVSATCAGNAALSALKSVKVYADAVYINILVEIDAEQIADTEWVPFHCYINCDNSDATGGYGDEFADPNADILLETAIISGGANNNYNPAVFHWYGEVGGSGWDWTDPNIEADDTNGWGAIVPEGSSPIGNSQMIGNNKFEIQLLRELIPAPAGANWADTFGIGFDIQQNWSSVGVLPNADADADGNNVVAPKLTVKVSK